MEGLVFVAVWEVVSALWEVYETHPREVVKFDKDPNRVLLDGLVDPRTQQMALLELDEIATSSPQGRKRIFSELKGTVKPFNAIASECLAIVGETYRIAESKGVVSSGAASAPAKGESAPARPSRIDVDVSARQHRPRRHNRSKQHHLILRSRRMSTSFSLPLRNPSCPGFSPPPISRRQHRRVSRPRRPQALLPSERSPRSSKANLRPVLPVSRQPPPLPRRQSRHRRLRPRRRSRRGARRRQPMSSPKSYRRRFERAEHGSGRRRRGGTRG